MSLLLHWWIYPAVGLLLFTLFFVATTMFGRLGRPIPPVARLHPMTLAVASEDRLLLQRPSATVVKTFLAISVLPGLNLAVFAGYPALSAWLALDRWKSRRRRKF